MENRSLVKGMGFSRVISWMQCLFNTCLDIEFLIHPQTRAQIIHWGKIMIPDIFVHIFAKTNRHGSNSYKSKLNEWHVNVAGWVKIKDVWPFFSHTVCYELLHIAVWLEAQSGMSTLAVMHILYLMCLFI